MKRKDYEKPTMRVFELQHRTMILAGSMGDRGDYTKKNTNPFEDEE